MKDFHVTIRVANNQLRERRDELGLTQKQMAVAAGVGINDYAALEGMRVSPLDREGEWRSAAKSIAAFHCVEPEELWPEAILEVETSRANIKVNAGEFAAALPAQPQHALPEDAVCSEELKHTIQTRLAIFPERVERILVRRFGLDGQDPATYREIGRQLGLSTERIRQIEDRALRQLRRSEDHVMALQPFRP